MENKTIIGIDLGTSTSEAAVIKDGKPVMILDYDSRVITPSAVGVDEDGQIIVGEPARAQYILRPADTAIEIKRKIGTKEKISLGRTKHSAVELSAEILKHIRRFAGAYLEEEVTHAVISVPAYFDEIQRQETMQAGQLAGFTVERIINEPTAAALSYGLGHMEEESHILVYDLGGGTFDVTLLEMFDGVLEVKASSGDNALGGKDFDEKIITYLANRFKERYGVDLRNDLYAMVKLKEEAEKCKKALSTEDSYRVILPMIAKKAGETLGLDETIDVGLFEELTADLIERTHKPIDTVLGDAGIMPEEIDRILLVGGSTKMPVVAADIEKYLHKEPSKAVNPDYAVAEGAAIQAGMIAGSIDSADSLMMTDVNPYTLGIRAIEFFNNDCMSVIIPRNVTIPVTKSEIYSTFSDYQTKAEIEVYQGEERYASRNHFLGKFELSGIPPKAAGKEKLEVKFSYNLNGMLEVRAKVLSTGASADISINMMENAQAPVDVEQWKDAPGAKAFRTLIRRAEKLLKDKDKWIDEVEEIEVRDLIEELEECLYNLKRALVEEDMDAAREYEDELQVIIEEVIEG